MAEQRRKDDETGERATGPNSKVARVIRDYALVGLGEELEEYWSDDVDERRSLRELAEYVNHELLRSVMERANISPLDGEVENTYRLLTADDVSSGMRTQAEASLEQEGVDLDRLRTDFVSHQAVHTYLTNYRDAEAPDTSSDEDQISSSASTIERLKNRLAAVTEKNLRTLRKTDRISLGNFTLFVDVGVFCNDCQTRYDVVELLSAGSCDCTSDS